MYSFSKPERRYQVDGFDTTIIKVNDKTRMDEHGHYGSKDTLIIKPIKRWVIEPAEYATESAPMLTYDGSSLTYVLVNSVKEIDSTLQIDRAKFLEHSSQLQDVVDSLKLVIANQEARIARLEAQNNINRNEVSDIILEQNNPNPYSSSTTITYYIPNEVIGKPQLVVNRSTDSVNLLSFEATKGIPTQQIIDASTLNTGVYVYSLILQGNVLASKKMIVIK